MVMVVTMSSYEKHGDHGWPALVFYYLFHPWLL